MVMVKDLQTILEEPLSKTENLEKLKFFQLYLERLSGKPVFRHGMHSTGSS